MYVISYDTTFLTEKSALATEDTLIELHSIRRSNLIYYLPRHYSPPEYLFTYEYAGLLRYIIIYIIFVAKPMQPCPPRIIITLYSFIPSQCDYWPLNFRIIFVFLWCMVFLILKTEHITIMPCGCILIPTSPFRLKSCRSRLLQMIYM